MATYTQLTDQQIRDITDRYPLRIHHTEPLHGGAANSSYLLHTDTGRHVLTVLDNHDHQSATTLAAVMQHAAAHGIPTNRPLPDHHGATITTHHQRPVIIKTYLDGHTPDLLPDNLYEAAGQLLARIHTTPPPPALPRHGRRLPTDWRQVAAQFPDQEFAAWLHHQHDNTAAVETLDGPTGLIHGDYFPDNLVTNHEHIAVLDWETATRDLLILDLGMAITGLCRHHNTLQPHHTTTLVNGYQKHRTLTTAELETLRDATIYSSLIIAYHRYRRHHLTHPDPTKTHLYQQIPPFIDSIQKAWPDTGLPQSHP